MANRIAARLRAWGDRHYVGLIVSGFFALFVLVFFADRIFITIPAGHGGAYWSRFFGGTALTFRFSEGTKMIPPWDRVYVYDLRVQQVSERFDLLTKEGLMISSEVTLRFRLNPDALGWITAYAGPHFVKTLVMPTVGATTRLEFAKFTAEEIYSTRRHEIEQRVQAQLSEAVDQLIPGRVRDDKPEIFIQDFWFRSITLPIYLASSIEAKLTQQQLAQQYVFILEREGREAQRKKIEAEGIRDFQNIVSTGISDTYLRWKGIDATLKLAESANSKIVIIGGKDGLPLILGPLDSGQTIQAPAAGAKQAEAGQGTAAPSTPQQVEDRLLWSNSYLDGLGGLVAPLASDLGIVLPSAALPAPSMQAPSSR